MTMDREGENFVSRRAMLPIAAGALASAAAIPAVAQTSQLTASIEAHHMAFDAFDAATLAEDRAETAFRHIEREREPVAVACFDSTVPYRGGIVDFERCRNAIENTYEFFTGAVERMRERNPAKRVECSPNIS